MASCPSVPRVAKQKNNGNRRRTRLQNKQGRKQESIARANAIHLPPCRPLSCPLRGACISANLSSLWTMCTHISQTKCGNAGLADQAAAKLVPVREIPQAKGLAPEAAAKPHNPLVKGQTPQKRKLRRKKQKKRTASRPQDKDATPLRRACCRERRKFAKRSVIDKYRQAGCAMAAYWVGHDHLEEKLAPSKHRTRTVTPLPC